MAGLKARCFGTMAALFWVILSVTACGPRESHGWPPNQDYFGRNPNTDFNSWSSVKAVFPPDVQITPPDAGAPPEMARLSGIWAGYWCGGRNTDIKLAIEMIAPTEARAVIGIAADGGGPPINARFTIKPVGANEYEGTYAYPDGSQALARLRFRVMDGFVKMDIMRTRLTSFRFQAAGDWCSGVLIKETK